MRPNTKLCILKLLYAGSAQVLDLLYFCFKTLKFIVVMIRIFPLLAPICLSLLLINTAHGETETGDRLSAPVTHLQAADKLSNEANTELNLKLLPAEPLGFYGA